MDPRILIEKSNGTFGDLLEPDSRKKSASHETVRLLPAELGQGAFTSMTFHAGMEICLSNCRFTHDYRAKIRWDSPLVTFAFSLSGRTCTLNSCCRKPIPLAAGDSYVHYFPDPELDRQTEGSRCFKGLVIRATPQMLERMIHAGGPAQERETERLHRALERQYLLRFATMTSQMKLVLLQMFACPHGGVIRKIYLESKAMELIAYQLEQLISRHGRKASNGHLKHEDRDRLYLARDILVSRMKYPPSLPELAQAVGMSHTRLNRGFRKFFGCTVFEYLRRERLEYARLLLAEGVMAVTEVAFETGFCSSSHFSAAFLRYFGVAPFKYRKNLVNGSL